MAFVVGLMPALGYKDVPAAGKFVELETGVLPLTLNVTALAVKIISIKYSVLAVTATPVSTVFAVVPSFVSKSQFAVPAL
jgi:hypothetical protein